MQCMKRTPSSIRNPDPHNLDRLPLGPHRLTHHRRETVAHEAGEEATC
jgi:hypothetical protein